MCYEVHLTRRKQNILGLVLQYVLFLKICNYVDDPDL